MSSSNDLSEEEEAKLPTPPGWVKVLAPGSQELSYRDTRTGVESHEHPYIVSATNAASKLPLPEGWSAKVVVLDDGAEDTFYRNEREGVSMWDHPLIRQCLGSILVDEGHGREAEMILGDLSGNQELPVPASDFDERFGEMQKSYDEFRRLEAELKENEQIGRKKPNYLNVSDEEESAPAEKSLISARVNEMARDRASSSPVMPSTIDKKVSFDGHFDGHGKQHSSTAPGSVGSLFERVAAQQPFYPAGVTEGGISGVNSERDWGQGAVEELTGEDVDLSAPSSSESTNKGTGVAVDSLFHGVQGPTPVQEGDGGVGGSNYARMWSAYKAETMQTEEQKRMLERHSHTLHATKPPRNLTGVKVLTEDVRAANERVQELLIQIRATLSESEGIPCRVLHEDEETSALIHSEGATTRSVDDGRSANGEQEEGRGDTEAATRNGTETSLTKRVSDLVVLGADILSELRERPEYIISAMALCDPMSAGMAQIAFTALHRIFHPFSTDPSLTSLFLLQSVNYQIEEVIRVGQIFSELDKKKLASRALFISDPRTALNWVPLAQPLPVVPTTLSETVLTCTLRTFAVRRDITAFFRCAWRPILHSIQDVTATNNIDGSRTWNNLILTASRLIECTFSEAVMASFPPAATAVARSLYQVGGNDALHFYMFNFLLLPNLLKVLDGDHESTENERTLRLDQMAAFSTRYFDIESWWPAQSGISHAPYDPASTLVWVFWKLYIGASLISQADIEILSAGEFFAGHPTELNTNGIKDKKLRIIMLRCQRRIDHGCQCLLRMPLDVHGSSFLNIDPATAVRDLTDFCDTVPKKSMEKRMANIVLKPHEMTGLTVMGRHELANMFCDIGVALEHRASVSAAAGVNTRKQMSKAASMVTESVPEGLDEGESALFLAVSEYLLINDALGDEEGEELLVLPFRHHSDNQRLEVLARMVEGGQGGVSEAKTEGSGKRNNPTLVAAMSSEFESNLKQRYTQLSLGLDLANRYELALLRILQDLVAPHALHKFGILPAPTVRSVEEKLVDTQRALARLCDPDNKDWYIHAELELDFARDDADGLVRHTATSLRRLQKSLHGLEPVRHVKLHPSALPGNRHYAHEDLFEDIMDLTLDDDKGFQTSAQKQKDFWGSFRFHSSQHHVASSTSLLDSNHQGAKVLEHSKIRLLAKNKRDKRTGVIGSKDLLKLDERSLQGSYSLSKTQSKYTKPTVDDSSRFMQQTKSHKNRLEAVRHPEVIPEERKTHHQLTTEYMHSLRSGDSWGQQADKKRTSLTYNASDGHLTMLEAHDVDNSRAQAFPEHLRHRIRGSKEQHQVAEKTAKQGEKLSKGGLKRQKVGGMAGDDFLDARDMGAAAREDVDELLRSYQEVFNKDGGFLATSEDHQNSQLDDFYTHEARRGEDERFSQFSDGTAASSNTSSSKRSGSTSNLFQMFDSVDDEELPEELPASVDDPDLQAAWKYMSKEEKRQSIHYFFPRGSTSAASQRRERDGVQRALPTPIAGSQHFKEIKGTKSSSARMRAKSRKSMHQQDVGAGMIAGVNRDRDHFNRRSTSPGGAEGKPKPPFRPAGMGGLDKTLSQPPRVLATRPKRPTSPPKSPPRGSFSGTRPELSRHRTDPSMQEDFGQDQDRDDGGRDNDDEIERSSPVEERQRRGSWHEPEQFEHNFTDRNSDQDFYHNEAEEKEEEEELSPMPASAPLRQQQKKPLEPAVRYPRQKREAPAAEKQHSNSIGSRGRNRSNPSSSGGNDTEKARKQQQWDDMDRSGAASPEGLPSPQKSIRVADSLSPRGSAKGNTANAGRTPGPASGEGTPRRPSVSQGVEYVPGQYAQSNLNAHYRPGERKMSPKPQDTRSSPTRRSSTSDSGHHSAGGARRRLSTGGSFKKNKDSPLPERSASPSEPRKSVSFKDQTGSKEGETDKAEPSDGGEDEDADKSTEKSKQEGGDGFEPSAAGTPPPPQQEKNYYDEDVDSKYAYSPEASPPPPSMQRRGQVVRDSARLVQQLQDGILMTKHGRRGQPKRKMLFLDENKTKLIWQELEGQRSLRKSIVMMVSSKPEEDKCVAMSDITEVRKGVQTEVMLTAHMVDPYVSLSIVTEERTLDMTFDTHAMRDLVLRALRVLLGNSADVRFF